MFIRFMEDIEARSPWKYSGDCDLILANAHYDATKREVRIDLKHHVQCKLKQMKDIGAINSVTSFFEDIVRYAEHADGEDPTWGFSDAQGAKLAGSALRRFILARRPVISSGSTLRRGYLSTWAAAPSFALARPKQSLA